MKIVFNDPKTGHAFQKEVDKAKTGQLIGKKIGDEIQGAIIGLEGYTLKITGGSTADGVPMRLDIYGSAKVKALLPSGPGIHPKYLEKGMRIKKRVAGNTIAIHTAQVNAVITASGTQALDALGFTPKPKEAKSAKADEKK